MSSTRIQEIKRYLGENDDFILYMFKEDLEMIESWAKEPSCHGKPRPSGELFGLWTNTQNPVVHIVINDSNSQSENPIENPLFSFIGYWSSERLREDVCSDIKSKQNTRIVFVSVEEFQQDNFAYRSLLFVNEGQKRTGRIEPLQGKNPFKLSNIPPNEEENARRERGEKAEGKVSSLRNIFEAKAKVQISPSSTARCNPQEMTSYASVAKQANLGNWSKVPDQTSTNTTFFSSNCKTSPSTQERLKEKESENVSDYSCTNQWYEIQPETLRKTLDFVRSLADDQNTVNISRDRTTLDTTMTFTHHNNEWSIDFPADFPVGSVKLKKKFRPFDDTYPVEGRGKIDRFKAELKLILQGQCEQCNNYNTRYNHSNRYY
ncbi:uncharacterized protein LOC116301203 [Actinia tenebrosa]|uniref:Uncharacterized protein LOC116301203 n=1 Tax=Actinia tenebrosa TaxID=6105 RepID=A0A6P8IHL0_ACTTE|nr:uncharacterized protein LOC116301203 [Actinia tenebrosa]